jgi:hypothetical protein
MRLFLFADRGLLDPFVLFLTFDGEREVCLIGGTWIFYMLNISGFFYWFCDSCYDACSPFFVFIFKASTAPSYFY